jgi:AcrR family transcriptional regulator
VPGMGSTSAPEVSAAVTSLATPRRQPTQARSRERVAKVLDAAVRLVLADGVDQVTTRSIAGAAGLPVASLYQYFADKEDVLLALCERDTAEMDAQVAEDLAAAPPTSLAELASVSMRAFVKVYARRPSFLRIWLHGRTNAAINDYCREHNRRIAAALLDFARDADLIDTDRFTDEQLHAAAFLAVEVGDTAFGVAYEDSLDGDPFLVEEAINVVAGYLSRLAKPPAAGAA